jgi:hypothetical protein
MSHPLPTAPVSGQPRGAALLSHTIAACPHVLQPHDDPDVRRLGNMRAYIENMQA